MARWGDGKYEGCGDDRDGWPENSPDHYRSWRDGPRSSGSPRTTSRPSTECQRDEPFMGYDEMQEEIDTLKKLVAEKTEGIQNLCRFAREAEKWKRKYQELKAQIQ